MAICADNIREVEQYDVFRLLFLVAGSNKCCLSTVPIFDPPISRKQKCKLHHD